MEQLKNKNKQIRIRVTVLLQREDGKICFARHCKDGRRYWLLPGGGQEVLESASAAAARELAEELCIKAERFELRFVRESMDNVSGRHIQFLVFAGINPDFSTLNTGEDERVEGFDFFGPDEIDNLPIYPAMHQDLKQLMLGKKIELFRTLEWIP